MQDDWINWPCFDIAILTSNEESVRLTLEGDTAYSRVELRQLKWRYTVSGLLGSKN